MTYVGFLRGGARLMNDQAQLGLAIGGPVLLVLIGLAPWVIKLLYSADFSPAVTLLQWQTVGNVFKLASWAMSFSIVAAARAKTYFFMELSFNIVFLGMVLILLPFLGLQVTAFAFVLGYLVYLVTVYTLARRILGFRWQALSLGPLGLDASLAVALLALMPALAAAVASPILAAVTGLFGLRVVLIKIGPDGRLASRLTRLYAGIGCPIRRIS
jgi:PST family polysaccharide transporter